MSTLSQLNIIEQNPPDPICILLLNVVYAEVSKRFRLKTIFAGYNKITDNFFEEARKSIFGNAANVGLTSTIGFDLNYISNLYQKHKVLNLYYLAIPIDGNDFILENGMQDWDFSDALQQIVKRQVSPTGALSYGDFSRCRTFKWFDE
jgi:hypothetical protein